MIYCPRLPQKEVEEIFGEAEVLQQFEINKGRKLVPVAGSRCISGILKRNALFRVERSGIVIHEGIVIYFDVLSIIVIISFLRTIIINASS